ncbi:hypothetical protein MK489_24465 [Myxococcota bacterium]|nr:hypothetical protein [Myxococcota bacterium]
MPVRNGWLVSAMGALLLLGLACDDGYAGSSVGGTCGGTLDLSGSFTCQVTGENPAGASCPAQSATMRLQQVAPECPGLVSSHEITCAPGTVTELTPPGGGQPGLYVTDLVYTGSGVFGPVNSDAAYNYALTTWLADCTDPVICNSLDCSQEIRVAGRAFSEGRGMFSQPSQPSYLPDISNFGGTVKAIPVTLLSSSTLRINGSCAAAPPADPDGELCAQGGAEVMFEVQGIEISITTEPQWTARQVADALEAALRDVESLGGIYADVPTNLNISANTLNPTSLLYVEAPITSASSNDTGILICIENDDCPVVPPPTP